MNWKWCTPSADNVETSAGLSPATAKTQSIFEPSTIFDTTKMIFSNLDQLLFA